MNFSKSTEIMISHHQLIDNSTWSYHNDKRFQPIWTKMASKWPGYGKKLIPINGIIVILRAILAHIHNLAKHQYYSIRE